MKVEYNRDEIEALRLAAIIGWVGLIAFGWALFNTAQQRNEMSKLSSLQTVPEVKELYSRCKANAPTENMDCIVIPILVSNSAAREILNK